MIPDNKDLEKTDAIIEELKDWPAAVLNSHKSASHPIHKLVFLADTGFTVEDARIRTITEKILQNKSKEGLYQVKMNIPVHFGGTGEDQFAWALCDAPLILYALVKLGVDYEKHLKEGTNYLFGIARENGWPCKCSDELGKFRGPGKKDDPCPNATLLMLKLASVTQDYRDSESTRNGAEALLHCWEQSEKIHPYMFFMGNDFRKLKLPFIWYDILHVADTLSRFEWVKEDRRFREMITIIQNKKNSNGEYIPESVWQSWKDWDFGQKKKPSKYLTAVVNELMGRISPGQT